MATFIGCPSRGFIIPSGSSNKAVILLNDDSFRLTFFKGITMREFNKKRFQSVSDTGAVAGAVVIGHSQNNMGLRLSIKHAQRRGLEGPIIGGFVILDAGDNRHSDVLIALMGRETDTSEVTAAIRRNSPGCVSVANTNILSLE